MAALPEQLNGDDAPENDFEAIDAGTYSAEIIGSNGTKKDDGRFVIGLQFKVGEGAKEGRTFWLNFNFLNPKSAINAEISQKQLKQIAKAVGVSVFENTEDLHGRAMTITVKKREYNGNFSNEMSSVKPYQNAGSKPAGSSAPKSSNGAKQGANAGAGGGSNRPWGNR